jgi:hypothetical protein
LRSFSGGKLKACSVPTDSQLRQTSIDVLSKELKTTRPRKNRCEIALAVLTELRETAEDSKAPEQELQDFVKEEYVRTAIQLEMERRLIPSRRED